MERRPMPHEIYRHFKGNLYQIVTIAQHSESGEQLVIYQALYGDYKTYARPLSMFTEEVDHEKYSGVTAKYRFERVDMEKKGKNALETIKKVEFQTPKCQNDVERDAEESEEMIDLDPMVLEFLEADTYEERLNILAGLHHRITDDMINVMAMATDIEVKPGDVETRFAELRSCLITLERFECNRLR